MLRLALFLLFLFLAPVAANAASCTFSVTNVNFGNVDVLAGSPVDTTATLNINCTSVVSGFVRVCPNLNAGSEGATAGIRHMRFAGTALFYNLYQNAARSIPWGSAENSSLGSPPTFDFTTSVGGSVSATRTIYARVLGNQPSVGAGLYTSQFSGSQTRIIYGEVATFNCATSAGGSFRRATFSVQANVAANCSVTAQNINFGSHGVLDAAADATGGIAVSCTPGTAYNVGLNNGLSGTSPTARRMTLGGQAVTYGLYKDAARSEPWGGTIGTDTAAGVGAGATQDLPVYGRVPAQSTPPPGTYTDTVVVTVIY
ncbi:spore coat U domain-containing protein [Mesorhizobium sp.]|uniref:Csu type fimbrial protein n=1 Tax=Mesorhizobium sp. TaxID=1871066 RepID=UPI000FE9D601|nr:spore coat U domain-containing protein [Mesorhizobium sp.]RWE80846.1 MAG: SCPU domain-containing protein [Mesorhizobium sp.]